MALTSDKKRDVKNLEHERTRGLNVPATTEIFEGTILTINPANGLAEKAPVTGASLFAGIAKNHYNEDTGVITTNEPLVASSGHLERLTMDVTPNLQDVGKKVYYVADDSISLTIVVTTGVAGSQVGIIAGLIEGDDVYVDTSKAISA